MSGGRGRAAGEPPRRSIPRAWHSTFSAGAGASAAPRRCSHGADRGAVSRGRPRPRPDALRDLRDALATGRRCQLAIPDAARPIRCRPSTVACTPRCSWCPGAIGRPPRCGARRSRPLDGGGDRAARRRSRRARPEWRACCIAPGRRWRARCIHRGASNERACSTRRCRCLRGAGADLTAVLLKRMAPATGRDWRAAGLAAGRRVRKSSAPEATAVHFVHACASQVLFVEFAAPGAVGPHGSPRAAFAARRRCCALQVGRRLASDAARRSSARCWPPARGAGEGQHFHQLAFGDRCSCTLRQKSGVRMSPCTRTNSSRCASLKARKLRKVSGNTSFSAT